MCEFRFLTSLTLFLKKLLILLLLAKKKIERKDIENLMQSFYVAFFPIV